MRNLWRQRDPALTGRELVGFAVHASDGPAGVVAEATLDASPDTVVVRRGRWFRTTEVVLPTRVIDWIDSDRGILLVGRSRDQIRRAPLFAPAERTSPAVMREPAIVRERAAS
jgi:hypothetical protein